MKIGLFQRVKKWSELNQTWCAVSSVYVESRRERISAIACPWKKLGFHTKIPINSKNSLRNFQIRIFDWVVELSKFNQTWYAASSVYVEPITEKISAIPSPWKKLGFHTKIPINSNK